MSKTKYDHLSFVSDYYIVNAVVMFVRLPLLAFIISITCSQFVPVTCFIGTYL